MSPGRAPDGSSGSQSGARAGCIKHLNTSEPGPAKDQPGSPRTEPDEPRIIADHPRITYGLIRGLEPGKCDLCFRVYVRLYESMDDAMGGGCFIHHKPPQTSSIIPHTPPRTLHLPPRSCHVTSVISIIYFAKHNAENMTIMVIYRRKYVHLFTRNMHMCYQSPWTTII